MEQVMQVQDTFIKDTVMNDNDWRNKLQRRDRLYYFSSFLFVPYAPTDTSLGDLRESFTIFTWTYKSQPIQ